jgi:pilus assembly protein TadC
LLDRLGTFLVEVSDTRRGRILLVLGIAAIASTLEYLLHLLIVAYVPHTGLGRILDSVTIGIVIGIITIIEVNAVHQRRNKVIEDMRVVRELNHHVRNALQIISYAARVPETKQQVAIIDESIARIDSTLKELFPTIDRP